MSLPPIDRREFLMTGAAAAGSLACPSFLRAAHVAPPTLDTAWLLCPDSSTWPDLSATAVAALLAKPRCFLPISSHEPLAEEAITGSALLTLHGAAASPALKSCLRIEVIILFTFSESSKARRFLAAVIKPGGEPASPLRCRVPLDKAGRVNIVLKVYPTDDQSPVECTSSIPAGRALYALTLGEQPRSAGDFRFEGGYIRADAPAFVVLSLDAADGPAAPVAK